MSRKDHKKYDCFGKSVFHLKDNDYKFSLDMVEVLKMLQDAIIHTDLPKLPKEWVKEVERTYGIEFANDISEG